MSKVFKRKRWRKMIFFIVIVLILILTIRSIIRIFNPSINDLIEVDKCPMCYGVSICSEVNKELKIHSSWKHLFRTKNVFYGQYKGIPVVLKKLAHDSELQTFDQTSSNENKNIESELSLDFTQDDQARIRLCPTTENLQKLLLRLEKDHSEMNIWMLLKLNPEPLMLQILSKGWPVPKYFGACGRIVVEEYVGPTLTYYYDEPWITRAKISSSLLKAAHTFTFQDKEFSFYLTDVSADNIAVDSNDNAIFVDLENLIIVDKNNSRLSSHDLEENHLDCSNCFAFSSQEICGHRLSDHNYYAVCQVLLSPRSFAGGLLHDLPKDYQTVQSLVEKCIFPDGQGNRITHGIQLENVLNKIIAAHY